MGIQTYIQKENEEEKEWQGREAGYKGSVAVVIVGPDDFR